MAWPDNANGRRHADGEPLISGVLAHGIAVPAVAALQLSDDAVQESDDDGAQSPFALYPNYMTVSDYIFRGISLSKVRRRRLRWSCPKPSAS